ncbi:DUF2767 family protein [Serratia marcescens]|uniref:DUF2767 family protein n=1 Tax=Serratia marcescens TaxID=615 RepID=UPI00197E3507|nr:DUF2767 family protein [Serratia marcescens]MBN3978578.1 DUF2767 family protein [Serratia marcescens]
MDMEMAHDEMCRVIGEAVIHLRAEGREVTADSIIAMMTMLQGGEFDMAVEFAVDLLRE